MLDSEAVQGSVRARALVGQGTAHLDVGPVFFQHSPGTPGQSSGQVLLRTVLLCCRKSHAVFQDRGVVGGTGV